jgi:hypothetical protein
MVVDTWEVVRPCRASLSRSGNELQLRLILFPAHLDVNGAGHCAKLFPDLLGNGIGDIKIIPIYFHIHRIGVPPIP